MKIIETAIPDVLVFEPCVHTDQRGYFFESFRQDFFETHAGKTVFVQENESFSGYGTLRGLHYQQPPFTQGKLGRAVRGKVLDIAVDLRKDSPTFGKHVAWVLSDDNKRMMWIPRGFAHGFIVLSTEALFLYKCDNYYSPEHDTGIIWNDPELCLDWMLPSEDIRVSEKDARLPKFSECLSVL